MNTLPRALLTFFVFLGTYALSWILMLLAPLGGMFWLGNLVALGVAVFAARRTWTNAGEMPESVLGTAAYGAAIIGGIGFAAGFFGPMIFAPGANQGPLLGIIYTGPAGAVLGAIGGFVVGVRRARASQD